MKKILAVGLLCMAAAGEDKPRDVSRDLMLLRESVRWVISAKASHDKAIEWARRDNQKRLTEIYCEISKLRTMRPDGWGAVTSELRQESAEIIEKYCGNEKQTEKGAGEHLVNTIRRYQEFRSVVPDKELGASFAADVAKADAIVAGRIERKNEAAPPPNPERDAKRKAAEEERAKLLKQAAEK